MPPATVIHAGWPDVLVALVVTLPSIIAAVAALRTHRQIRPSDGRRASEVLEDTRALAEDNAVKLQAIVNGEAEPPHGTEAVEHA